MGCKGINSCDLISDNGDVICETGPFQDARAPQPIPGDNTTSLILLNL